MSWRDRILQAFTPLVAPLTLVADPDSLLTEEDLVQEIQVRGFELIPFEDPVAFRFAYESKYRTHLLQGELTDLVVVLRAETQELRTLPYDLLQAGRQLSLSLRDLFPNLSYPVIQALDRTDLDTLYQAQTQYKPEPLGNNTTKDFVLRYVFGIAPELVNQASDLLLILLRRHYRGQRIPAILDDRLIQLLRERQLFSDWPLETIIPDRQAFFTFLQQRWPRFVTGQLRRSQHLHEQPANYVTPAPADLPFDAEDVRVYIDNLFLEGYLQPINIDRLGISISNLGQKEWVTVGLQIDPATDRKRRLEKLLHLIQTHLPTPEARHQDWLTFAYTWAELIVLWHEVKTAESLETSLDVQQQQFKTLQQQVDTAFLTWVKQRYGGLYNQPKLVMLHQIPGVIARHLQEQTTQKVALLVLDGLALDQWLDQVGRNK